MANLLKISALILGKNVPATARKDIEKKEEIYDRLCCLKNFTIIGENYLLGYV